MENKAVGCLFIVVLLLVFGLGGFQFINKKIVGNKQIMDLRYTFRTAYIQMPDGQSRKVHIKKWNDYQNSDSVQIITVDDTVYYTHLNRVVLINEKE